MHDTATAYQPEEVETETGHTETIIDLIKRVNEMEDMLNLHAKTFHTVLDQQSRLIDQTNRLSELLLTLANLFKPDAATNVPSPTK